MGGFLKEFARSKLVKLRYNGTMTFLYKLFYTGQSLYELSLYKYFLYLTKFIRDKIYTGTNYYVIKSYVLMLVNDKRRKSLQDTKTHSRHPAPYLVYGTGGLVRASRGNIGKPINSLWG